MLPDLAGLPGPGQMAEYAEAGALKPLDDVLDMATYKAETAPALVELGTVDGKIVGVFIKAAVKGLIWYNPKLHDYGAGPPTTWDDLQSQAAGEQGQRRGEWCVGLESGAASGWPGTDWIEDIVLRQAGPDVYDAVVAGQAKWTRPAIKTAFAGRSATSLDEHATAAPTTVDSDELRRTAATRCSADPPGCVFHHQASFITGLGAFKTAAGRHRLRLLPVPGHRPAVRRRGRGRRRPVRHVPRHAGRRSR